MQYTPKPKQSSPEREVNSFIEDGMCIDFLDCLLLKAACLQDLWH